jgi:hypothetical protein
MMNPKTGDIWTYKKTGNRYWIRVVGQSKLLDGEWTDAVTYETVYQPGVFYTRDLKTFLEKFGFFMHPREEKLSCRQF